MRPIAYKSEDTIEVELVSDSDGTVYKGKYIDMRIDRSTIPDGMFAYDCRHDDDGDWVTPVTIEDHFVIVNFAGTLITNEKIVFPDGENYVPITTNSI